MVKLFSFDEMELINTADYANLHLGDLSAFNKASLPDACDLFAV
jgi:hypothetical protein